MAHQTVRDGGPRFLDRCHPPDARPTADCPVEVTLRVLRGRWTPLVLGEFFRHRERTYSELSAALGGLSDKVLTDRLAQLAEAGVLARRRVPGWPPRTHYTLTARGADLLPAVEALWEWGVPVT